MRFGFCKLGHGFRRDIATDEDRWTQIRLANLTRSSSQALYFNALTEIDQETNRNGSRCKVVEALSDVSIFKCSDGLDFDQYQAVNNQIRQIFSHNKSAITDGDRLLLQDGEPGFQKLKAEGIFIHLLRESTEQLVMHFIRAADHDSRNLIQYFFICGNISSPQHLNRPVMFPPVDDTRNLLGLLAVFAENAEFVLPVLTVPDGELPAEEHRDANLAGIGGD